MPSPYAAAAWRLTLSGELPQNLGVSALRALAGLVVGGGTVARQDNRLRGKKQAPARGPSAKYAKRCWPAVRKKKTNASR
jgi:hypothetical protein